MRALPRPSKDAFVLDVPAGSRAGNALLLHGLTGTPYEVRVVADALHQAGYACVGPVLPGHGADPAALTRLRHTDWLAAARQALAHIPAREPLLLVGCSMGGLLALHLALERHVDGVVLLAPALRFHPAGAAAVAVIARTRAWRLRAFLPKKAPGGDVAAPDAQRHNPTYKVLPVFAMAELLRLQTKTRAILSSISAPLCILHGNEDSTIDPSSSAEIARRVKSPRVEHHRLKNSRHLIGLDVDRDDVCDLAVRFARTHASEAA